MLYNKIYGEAPPNYAKVNTEVLATPGLCASISNFI